MLRTGKSVAEICTAAEVSPEAGALLKGAGSAAESVVQLVEEGNFADAVAFLAHALPAREGIWWAWLCARDAAGETPSAGVLGLLETIKSWIAEPTDERRRAALNAAQPVGFTTAVGCTALAVFLTGETLGPATSPPAPPGEFAAAKAIAGSIHLSATSREDVDVAARYRQYVKSGIELAERIQLWPSGGSNNREAK